MRERGRLVRGKSGRVVPYCERCGRVDGPLPFGRGEVMLMCTTRGYFCQDCPPPMPLVSSADALLAELSDLMSEQERVAALLDRLS